MNRIQQKWQKYCNEELSNIENYEEAIKNPDDYVVHHKMGIYTSSDELKDHDLYYNRPAKELIFLTKSEHVSLHDKLNDNWRFAQKNRVRTAAQRANISKAKKAYKRPDKMIVCVTNNKIYITATQAAKELNIVTSSNIYKCCYGLRKKANGYEFRWFNKDTDFCLDVSSNSVNLF